MRVKIGKTIFHGVTTNDPIEIQKAMWAKKKEEGSRICVLNTRVWYLALTDPNYNNLVNTSDFVVADGFPLHKIIEHKIKTKIPRIRGIDVFKNTLLENKKAKHLFLGTNQITLDKLEERLCKDNLLPVFSDFIPLEYGLVDEIITTELINYIRSQRYDFIWISLGAPKQDYAAAKIHSACGNANVAGVGLVFDYLAGNVKQPPEIFLKYGLEWLFRIFTQTSRTKHFIIPFFVMLFFYIFKLGKVLK